jgi:ribosomal protein L16/L10AE
VIGHVAKAGDWVSEDQIEAARIMMARLGLTPELRRAAMHLFNQG